MPVMTYEERKAWAYQIVIKNDRNQPKQVDDLYASGLEAFATGDFKQAIVDWEAALELNQQFRPAIEALITARKRLELQEEMISRQRAE